MTARTFKLGKVELPVCPVCGNVAIRCTTHKKNDCGRSQLREVLGFACGAAVERVGNASYQRDQPAGANGYAGMTMPRSWTETDECPEALRLLLELREDSDA